MVTSDVRSSLGSQTNLEGTRNCGVLGWSLLVTDHLSFLISAGRMRRVIVMRTLSCVCRLGLSSFTPVRRREQPGSAERSVAQGSEPGARGLASSWTLDSCHILPPLSLVLYPGWGLWMRVPGLGGLQRAEGLPEAQVQGLGREGQASCYGERNVMRLTCLTGGLEKYPCPSGASEPSIIWKGSFHDEGYLCG